MSRKTLGIIAIALSVALIVIAALADVIGIGDEGRFGLQQISGLVVGVLGVVFGWLFGFRGSSD